ncbi:MAG: AbrB/MazE/SpoVT family DNA-binding domain-containing protein [Deltaproteobacteria bacterium]|nr:AbrB/MazE/SpoVT family DNA-binding domain-containing protein [Deltaproteobacteria bacterium]
MKSIVSERGQVVIPKALRVRLAIGPGQALDFQEERGRLVATKLSTEDPVANVYGVLRIDRSTDEIMRDLRGEVDAVELVRSRRTRKRRA